MLFLTAFFIFMLMKDYLLLICLLIVATTLAQEFTRADSLRGNLFYERSCYDVYYYDLDVSVFSEKKYIIGSNSIYFITVSDFSVLQVDLFENMNIDSVYFEGKKMSFNREFNAVFISLNRTLKKNEKSYIQVYYSGNPQIAKNPPWDGGFSWDKDKNGKDWIGVSCQGLGASVWWPNKDHQSDEPDSMRISCSIPNDLQVICNGNLINIQSYWNNISQKKMLKYSWFVSYPINNYNVTLNIGDYSHFSDFYVSQDDSLLLDYYVLSYNLEKAKKHFAQVKPMLACFESFLGPYPFEKDGFALVETSYLGMEHQSAIAYGNNYLPGYFGDKRFIAGLDFDYIIVHEAGHEWWGNSITTNDIADMWVQEGFCTYSEVLFVECMYGYDAMINYVLNQKRMIKNDWPIIGKFNVNNEGSSDMYHKTSLILHTLRTLLKDDNLWFDILKGLLSEFSYQTVDGSDIIKYINLKSGYDLTVFFNQYLNEAKLPVFEYFIKKKRKKHYLNYKWKAIDGFEMPILALTENNLYTWIYPNSHWQQLELQGVNSNEFNVAEHLFLIDVEKLK